MPFYEVIYETGTHSVAEYADDDEARQALESHHERATSGKTGGPSGHPAERVKTVLKYHEHPATFNEGQTLNTGTVGQAVEGLVTKVAVGDLLSVPELAAGVRDLTSPLVMNNPPHESDYKMDSVGELSGTWN